MPHFSRNNSCAFTWTKTGDCHAVHITRKGDRCIVSAHWHGNAGKNTATAETLSSAKRALGNIDTYFTLAGGSEGGWGMADVLMPELKAEELKNALVFELRKHTPLPVDKLAWGYRMVPSDAQNNRQLVRLFYVRNETWRQWTDAVGGIGQVVGDRERTLEHVRHVDHARQWLAAGDEHGRGPAAIGPREFAHAGQCHFITELA